MIEYEFNSVVVLKDGMEIIVGKIPQIEPILQALHQKIQSPKRRYRRKKKILVSELIDEFMNDIEAE